MGNRPKEYIVIKDKKDKEDFYTIKLKDFLHYLEGYVNYVTDYETDYACPEFIIKRHENENIIHPENLVIGYNLYCKNESQSFHTIDLFGNYFWMRQRDHTSILLDVLNQNSEDLYDEGVYIKIELKKYSTHRFGYDKIVIPAIISIFPNISPTIDDILKKASEGIKAAELLDKVYNR